MEGLLKIMCDFFEPSLVVNSIAILLSLSFKRDADRVNKKTSELLTEIKAESRYISQGIMSELKAYGDSMRGAIDKNVFTNISSGPVEPTNFNVSNTSDLNPEK